MHTLYVMQIDIHHRPDFSLIADPYTGLGEASAFCISDYSKPCPIGIHPSIDAKALSF